MKASLKLVYYSFLIQQQFYVKIMFIKITKVMLCSEAYWEDIW